MSATSTPTPWRLLGVQRDEPRTLLARGLELLDGLAQDPTPLLRWYVPTTPAIVLGRGRRGTGHGGALPVLARHSGGGAVLMDDTLLSLDVLLPAGHPLLDGDLGAVFLRVGAAWAAALADLGVSELTVHQEAGVATRLGTPRERLLADVCYALPGKGEVLHRGRKLVGLAQRRRRHGALIQCGLLWRWRPEPLLVALGADPHDAEVHAAAVGLRDLVAGPPDEGAVVRAVEERIVRGATG